ncbi:hypothetical protein Godav_018027 [Gossypium davidsonii]|uniref:Uncharacterized protein n=1 Tax=Gossypium davidsonii TaxID=34287 RepID=A0A7J8QV41_GOSDV|nr:hypothetical protein [Gossypium davidsonii]
MVIHNHMVIRTKSKTL